MINAIENRKVIIQNKRQKDHQERMSMDASIKFNATIIIQIILKKSFNSLISSFITSRSRLMVFIYFDDPIIQSDS